MKSVIAQDNRTFFS